MFISIYPESHELFLMPDLGPATSPNPIVYMNPTINTRRAVDWCGLSTAIWNCSPPLSMPIPNPYSVGMGFQINRGVAKQLMVSRLGSVSKLTVHHCVPCASSSLLNDPRVERWTSGPQASRSALAVSA